MGHRGECASGGMVDLAQPLASQLALLFQLRPRIQRSSNERQKNAQSIRGCDCQIENDDRTEDG